MLAQGAHETAAALAGRMPRRYASYEVFASAVHDAVFAAHGWLKEIVKTHQYAIYEAAAFA